MNSEETPLDLTKSMFTVSQDKKRASVTHNKGCEVVGDVVLMMSGRRCVSRVRGAHQCRGRKNGLSNGVISSLYMIYATFSYGDAEQTAK